MSDKQYRQMKLDIEEDKGNDEGPVTCLGKVFDSEKSRRDYFIEELRKRLPELKKMEGYPIGEDEDILALSDPPYYTACPNPFIKDFINMGREKGDAQNAEDAQDAQDTQDIEGIEDTGDKDGTKYGTIDVTIDDTIDDTIVNEPYTGDLESSSRHPVYSFHPYHTKVPPEVIKKLILHYTNPGDVVFDGFSGTGMTGVAARESGRQAIISDLSPIATFISSVNTKSHDGLKAVKNLKSIITESEKKWGYLYYTGEGENQEVPVNYYVWSDVFTCPECVHEFPFFPTGVIHYGNKVETKKMFLCPSCGMELNVRKIERVMTAQGKKKALVWINAASGHTRINREPNESDYELVRHIDSLEIPAWYAHDGIDPEGYSAKLAQLGDKAITDTSKFLSKRNLIIFSDLWSRIVKIEDTGIRKLCQATLTSIFTVISERQGYFGGGGGMSGNLYMPIVRMEKNVYDCLRRKLGKMQQAEEHKSSNTAVCLTTTQSTTSMVNMVDNSVDYIYTDPPFGANIIYSEMNLILESWLRIKTNKRPEAVIDLAKNRLFEDYGVLMEEAFKENYRILKPGHWITVEFHNTQASIWNLIQNALGKSGFIVAQVSLLDKGSTTILGDIRPRAVVQDLIISAYKPSSNTLDQVKNASNHEVTWWSFIKEYLEHLPVFLSDEGNAKLINERTPRILFDRMVAFYIQNNIPVTVSSGEFHNYVTQRLPMRDGMVFLENQVAQYDKKRIMVKDFVQMSLMISDENSAIEWLRQQLLKKPQTRQELHPGFTREIQNVVKYEKLPELDDLLEQNFLQYDEIGPVPSQIHGYLSSNFKELRELEKEDPDLKRKAKDRWYVPDPNKQADLEKLREKSLLREFSGYVDEIIHSRKKLKQFRLEAIRAGFKKAWGDKDYQTIVDIGSRIPENVLQEDDKLLMYFDNAQIRLEM